MGAVDHLASEVDVVVIVDILSFSTCVDIAVGCGAEVLPCPWKAAEAAEFACQNEALLAGDRGTDSYSLSPASLLHIPAGTRLALPSPNGSTLSLASAAKGKLVIAGCVRNAAAIADWIDPQASVLVVPAGERWPDGSLRPAVEDLIGAGAIISRLAGKRSPESTLAVAAFESAKGNLLHSIRRCASGRELIERGFQDDIRFASSLDVSEAVPLLHHRAFRNCPF